MNGDLYCKLAWLPPAPEKFSAFCKDLPADGSTIRALANHGLDDNQLGRLGRAIMKMAAAGASLAPLQPLRLGILGNGTLDLLTPQLVASAARHGLLLDCIQADYGQTIQEALEPSSRINRAKPDAVLLAIDHRGLPLRFGLGDSDAEGGDIEAAIAQLTTMRGAICSHTGAICLVQTVPPPPEGLFGSLDRVIPGTKRHVIDNLNRAIVESMADTPDLLLDVAGLAETVGLDLWHSPALWNMAKVACDSCCMPIYAEHVVRLLAAMRGKSRKATPKIN